MFDGVKAVRMKGKAERITERFFKGGTVKRRHGVEQERDGQYRDRFMGGGTV